MGGRSVSSFRTRYIPLQEKKTYFFGTFVTNSLLVGSISSLITAEPCLAEYTLLSTVGDSQVFGLGSVLHYIWWEF